MYVQKEIARELIDQLAEEFPSARVVHRDTEGLPARVVLFIFMYRLLQFFNSNLSRFSFVVGQYIVLPSASFKFTEDQMTDSVYKIVRHEMVHLRQDRDNVLWKSRYLLWPLPALITERGYRWEMEAYKETMNAEHRLYGYVDDTVIDFIASQFSSPNYVFMDVRGKKVRKELEDHRASLEK